MYKGCCTCLLSLYNIVMILFFFSIGQGQSTQQMIITMQFVNQNNTSQAQQVTIYNNTFLNQKFYDSSSFFNCSNLNMFILQQDSINNKYSLILYNYSSILNVQIQVRYKQESGPTPRSYICDIFNETICIIPLQTNCDNDYSNNVVIGTVSTISGSLITKFQYNSVCNGQLYQPSKEIQWGAAVIIGFSFFLVFISAKYQFTSPYTNAVVFINYIMLIFYFSIIIIKNTLLTFQVPNVILVIGWACIGGSIIAGVFCSMICFGQVVYLTKINFFRWGYSRGRFRLRVMDVLGIVFGCGMMFAWYISGTNWLISDIIFVFIYMSVIKIIKIQSLKYAVIIYVITLIVDGIFYRTFSKINNQFINYQYNIFNNPLFFIVPILTHIPNRKCQWYFVLSMSFPALFMAYLCRFDINRSSKMYGLIFIVCFVICSILWFIVSIFIPFPFPYDLFTVPISVFVLLLFSNRRGQLKDLWSGQFYDEQIAFFQNQQQLIQKYRSNTQKVQYDESMFNNLKYDIKNQQQEIKKQRYISNINKYSFEQQQSKKKQSIQLQMEDYQKTKQLRCRSQVHSVPK